MDLKDPSSKIFLYKVRPQLQHLTSGHCVLKIATSLCRAGRCYGPIHSRGERINEAQFETSWQEICLHH